MTRSITGAMQTALAASTVRFCYLIEIEFSGTTLYFTTYGRNLTWNAHTWLGNGISQAPSVINESAELRANGFEISLGGIDSATLALVLSDLNHTQDGILYLCLLDSSEAVIVDPFVIAKGKFDKAQVFEGSDESIIRLQYESDLIRRERSNEFRYTNQAQQEIFSGDIGFEYTDNIEDWTGFWGKGPRPKAQNKKRKVKSK